MTSVAIIFNQVMVMFFLMAIGFVAHKRDFLGKQTIQEISDLVIYLVTPALIMRSLQMEFTPDTLTNVYVMGVLALLTTILMMAVSRLVSPQSHLSQYAMVFGNTGFIGIPIVDSLYGAQSVVYMAVFIAVVNVLVWTYGISLIAGRESQLSFTKLLTNPNNLAIVAGVLLHVMSFSLPRFIDQSIALVANLNLPLVMIVLGTYLAEAQLSRFLRSWEFYKVCFFRLLFIPITVIILLRLLPMTIDHLVAMTLVVAHATPGAVLLVVFAKKFQKDYHFSLAMISLTTLMSMLTIPLIIALAMLVIP